METKASKLLNRLNENKGSGAAFKVGDKFTHSDFKDGQVTITDVEAETKQYPGYRGAQNITVKAADGNTYTLYFNSETIRKQRRQDKQIKDFKSKTSGKVNEAKNMLPKWIPDSKKGMEVLRVFTQDGRQAYPVSVPSDLGSGEKSRIAQTLLPYLKNKGYIVE